MKLGYDSQGKISNSLVSDVNLTSNTDDVKFQQISSLKNSVYGIFFRQGIYAGQNHVGNPDFKYQRWQVPLVIGAMIDANRNYLGQFHDFLPNLAANNIDYANLLETVYRLNNWDTFPKETQQKLCKQTQHCLYIDDRLWWVNAFLSYADGLASSGSNAQELDKMIDYAYKIYINGVSRDDYLNEIGTPGAVSLMWFSSNKQSAEYKSTISNSLYVTAGARLAKLIKYRYGTDNSQYDYDLVLNNAQTVADGYFLKYYPKLNVNGLLLDGVTTGGNAQIHTGAEGTVINQVFTYNQGVVLPGMAILAQLTKKTKYLKFAKELIISSSDFASQHNEFFDDYGYLQANGWFADGDGIAFRLAYWQYLSLFLENYDLKSDPKFSTMLNDFINRNANQLVICPFNPTNYGWQANDLVSASPNHNNFPNLPNGKLFTAYPDGYSAPGIASALELLLLQQRIIYSDK